MPSGVWITLVIPAIIAFLFAVWVTYNMINDVSTRGGLGYQEGNLGGLDARIYPPVENTP